MFSGVGLKDGGDWNIIILLPNSLASFITISSAFSTSFVGLNNP